MPYNHKQTVSALIAYDKKQSTTKHYNRFALAIYLQGLQSAESAMAAGKPMRQALVGAFCGRLLDKVLKANDLPISTREEQRGF